MLSVRHIPRTQIVIANKWISIAHNMVRLSSNSSSSDSSDSDSDLDTRPQQTKKIANNNNNAGEKKDIDLYGLLDHYLQKSPSKHVDIKINGKDETKQLEHRIIKAAEMLTSSVGGDKEKIVSSLLFSLSAIKNKQPPTEPISDSPRKFKSKDAEKDALKNEIMKTRMRKEDMQSRSSLKMERESITRRLLKKDEKQEKPNEPSIMKQLLQKRKQENELSISKILLQEQSSVTEEASEKSPREIRPAMPSIITQLLKEKQESLSKTVSQKNPQERSVIQQLKEQAQRSTGQQSTVIKSEQLSIIKELLRESTNEMRQPFKSLEGHQKQEGHRKQEEEASVIKKLLKDHQERQESTPVQERQREIQERQRMILEEPSISRKMLNSQLQQKKSRFEPRKPRAKHYVKREACISPLHWILFDDKSGNTEKRSQQDTSMYSEIFRDTNAVPSKTVELDTWSMCEDKYMKMITKRYPQNAFQEMAQWTEEGKMWNFPINNEQGMDEEHNTHFSKHVFLEQHLTGWCPTKGPIRHFMELVCIGLSKNPYMTVQEKYDTIMWYRDYFADKNDLLKKLGLSEIEPNVEKHAQLAQ